MHPTQFVYSAIVLSVLLNNQCYMYINESKTNLFTILPNFLIIPSILPMCSSPYLLIACKFAILWHCNFSIHRRCKINITMEHKVTCSWLIAFLLLAFARGQDPNLADEIIVQLGNEDINAIKSAGICNDDDGLDCFISFLTDTIRDSMNNIIEGDSILTNKFTPDTTPPELTRFIRFDLDAGVIVLSFDEIIDTATANFSALSFHSAFDDTGFFYSLVQNITINSPEHSTELNFTLDVEDLNNIKGLESRICFDESACYVRFSSYFVQDVSGNYVEDVKSGDINFQAQRAITVNPDTTSPVLEAFIVDFDSNEVTLYFDETIEATSFEVTQITFTSNSSGSVSYTLTNAASTTDGGTSLTFEMINADTIQLKAMNFFFDVNDTYIIFSENLILDKSGNPVEARFADINALQAEDFFPDETSPIPMSFLILDMNNDKLSLQFDEPVDIAYVNYSAIVIRSAPLSDDTGVSVRLTGLVDTRYVSTDKRSIEISFNDDDILSLKLNPNIATDTDNSFLLVEAGAINDVFGNPNAPTTTALPLLEHIADSNGPELLSFVLDLDASTLRLNFSDVVDVSTLVTSGIVFQPGYVLRDGDPTVQLSDVMSNSNDGFVIVVTLDESDVNALNSYTDLANEVNNTYISVTADTIDDIFGINVISVTPSMALKAKDVIPDMTSPEIEAFSVDFNTEILSINFTEIVDLHTLDVTQITIQGSSLSLSSSLTLSGAIISSQRFTTNVQIEFTRYDLNRIKFMAQLAVNDTTTYLSITNAAFTDSNANKNKAIPSYNATKAAVYVKDMTAPILETVDLDLNEGIMKLTFDETVDAGSFDASQIQLQSDQAYPATFYMLTAGSSSSTNSPVITVNITDFDLNQIKKDSALATSSANTYITLSNSSVYDMNKVFFANVSSVRASFTPDTTRPELEAFILDLNMGLITLNFSETVDASSLNISSIVLLETDNETSNGLSYNLTGGVLPINSQTLSPDSTIIVVSLGSTDLNEIKQLTTLGTDEENTFISIVNSTIEDMNGNNVEPLEALGAENVIPDITSPDLQAFSLDLNMGQLYLTFSETVNATSLNISSIILHSTIVPGPSSYRLKSSMGQEDDAVIIVVDLSAEDSNSIKFLSDLGTMDNNTFLVIDDGSIFDMSDNPYNNGSTIHQVSVLYPDSTSPNITDFSLDIDSGLLVLTFSEVINSSTLDLPAITIQNAVTSPSSNFTFTGGNISISSTNDVMGHPPILNVSILFSDLNEIKRIVDLGVDNDSTFLSILDGAVLDLAPSPNKLIGIDVFDALPVGDFQEDITSPLLVDFYLNLTAETLLLVFDETVDRESIDVTQIQLQSKINDNNFGVTIVTLNDSSVASLENSIKVLLDLSQFDLNTVKLKTDLCTEESNCYISISNYTIIDMNENEVMEIDSTEAKEAALLTPDTILPEIVSLTLDMNEGTLLLSFTEPVDVSTLMIDEIVLLASPGATGNNLTHQLTPGSFPHMTSTDSSNGTTILLQIGTSDLYEIQQKEALATDAANSYINVGEGAVLDMNKNNLTAVEDEIITFYIDDESSPVLRSFILDLDNGVLSFTFGETVNKDSFTPGFFALRTSEEVGQPEIFLSSMTPIPDGSDWPIVNVSLTKNGS